MCSSAYKKIGLCHIEVTMCKESWLTQLLKKEQREKELAGPKYYMLWQSDEVAEEMRRIHNHIPAPKRLLPGHAESYNPPEEFLFNDREVSSVTTVHKTWKQILGNYFH